MKERPILFSGPMVRALLNGTKTQTRRVVKPTPWEVLPRTPGTAPWPFGFKFYKGSTSYGDPFAMVCPYGQPGDRLWVKETFCPVNDAFAYRASTDADGERCRRELGLHWKPSIFCTRKASRITLEVVSVRVERLNDISEADAAAEGYQFGADRNPDEFDPIGWYEGLWESINGAGAWKANPWVWVIGFKRAANVDKTGTAPAGT